MKNYSLSDFNWLAHKINNTAIKNSIPEMKGVVYDFGCGEKPYAEDIVNAGLTYVGIDWSDTIHDLHADIVSDLNKPLSLPNDIADNIISFQVLEHLYEPQVMLNETYRILKPGGGIFLSVPFQWMEHEVPHDYFRYTRYGLEYMFEKAGFQDIEIYSLTGFWVMWTLKLNYQLSRFTRNGPVAFRVVARILLTPLWFAGQLTAPVLDRFWPSSDEETAWFFVRGRKRES